MAKESGLGDNLYVGTSNVSGDINSVGKISGGPATLDVTGIDKFAFERIGGLRDGAIEFISYFNDAATKAHSVFKTLPTTDVVVSYLHGQVIGNPMASCVAKQLNYDITRGTDGALTAGINTVANGYGLEWGQQLTAGLRTDTAATNGTSLDTLASASFGGQAYLHLTSFTGTDVTIKIQDSADNSSFADVTSFTFGSLAAVTASRVALTSTATIRRYVRAVTTTTGGFSSAIFAVNLVKNDVTTVF